MKEPPIPHSAPPQGAERRQWERSPLVVTAEMIIRDEAYVSLSQNISGGGMFLRVPGPRDLGDMVRLKFRLGPTQEVVVDAEVVWSAQRRPMNGLRQLPGGVGVKFRNISDEDRALVMTYVEAVLSLADGPGTRPVSRM